MRLTKLLSTFPVALSAQQAAHLLTQLAMPTSGDTLLRLVKRSRLPRVVAPKVAGMADFALRRGKTSGTLGVELTTNRPVDLCAERPADALARWLAQHPEVEYLSRDRSSE